MSKLISLFLFVVLSAASVFAQTTSGSLSGTISGPDGVLPGATVIAVDNKTGKEQTVVADESGNFRFSQLEAGNYTVRISAGGFKGFTANDVKIDVGREYALDPKLEIGAVTENVTITAGADVVTSTTAQISNTVSPQQILSLPLLTRNPLSLAGLQAGVSANSAQATTINGMRTTFTNITRDGINIQDTFIRTNATDFAPARPSVDDTGEFTIATANQEADQGYGGAQIRLVTPRGTKNFHGALFAYNRNSKFAANNFFSNKSTNPDISRKPAFRNRNQYGGKVSGPLIVPGFGEGDPAVYTKKAVFFFAYEGIRDPLTDTNIARGNRTILLPTANAGGFQFNRTNTAAITNPFVNCPSAAVGSVCTVTNLLGYAQSLGLAVPTTIDPIIQSTVLSQLPTTPNSTGGDLLNTGVFYVGRRSNQARNQYSSRIDVDFTEKDSLNGVYNYNKESNLRPDADTTKFTTIPGVTQFSTNKQFTLAYRRVFTSNFVNEVRTGVFSSAVPFNRTEDVPSYFLSGLISTYPVNTFLNQGRETRGINFQDNADYVIGKHTLRFGGQTQIFKVDAYNDVATVPTVTIGPGAANPTLSQANFSNSGGINTTQLGTANALLSLFSGRYSSITQSFNIVDPSSGFQRGATAFTPFRYENHSLFVADRWSAAKSLTVNFGVRYELYPALRLLNNLALEPVLNPDNPVASLLDPNGTYNVIGTNAGRKNAYYKTDKNNFAPNIGVAYAPSFESGVMGFLFGQNKTVLRGGYSWVYGNDSIVTSINNAASGNAGLGRTAVTFQNLNGTLSGGFPEVPLPANPVLPRTYLQNNAAGIGNFFGTVFGIDPKLQTPKVEQYSFGIQREFGNTAFEARYVGTRSHNLGRGVDYNQIDIFNNGFLSDFQRAQNNYRLSLAANSANPSLATPFCSGVTAGCVPLTIFQSGGAAAAGRLIVGTGGLSSATFINNLSNGTPADLAVTFINSAANFNNQPSSANAAAVPRVNFLPNNGTGVVDYFCNCGKYNYNSLQLEVRRRFAHGLYFQGNYTFSKNLTDAVGTSQQLFEPYIDNNNTRLDYQRADFDTTHAFNFNGIYQLPFGKGKMFLNQGGLVDKIFGGFELSGLLQITSGAPITFVDTRGTFNRAGRSARQTPFSNLTNDQIRALAGTYRDPNDNIYFINPNILNTNGQASGGYSLNGTTFANQVFFNVDPGQTGNVGRALINGPAYYNTNMALLKSIRFTENMRIQLRAEAFNVFNRTNFIQNTQFANINSTAFGQITSAYDPRLIQFAARFEF